MIILPVSFKAEVGRPAGRGQICITSPDGAVKLTSGQEFKTALTGNWSGFPDGGVRHLNVVAHTRQDYPCFKVPVNGAATGSFSGELLIRHRSTPVRFDGFDLMAGQHMFSTNYHAVLAQLVKPQLSEIDGPLVTFPEDFIARILKVVRGWPKDGLIPVAVWFDVQKVPPGTNSLELYFIIDGLEALQRIKDFNGPDEYSFAGHLPADHPGVIGLRNGKVGTGCILRATTKDGDVLGAIRAAFDLDKAKRGL
jgi:hypothetical protein